MIDREEIFKKTYSRNEETFDQAIERFSKYLKELEMYKKNDRIEYLKQLTHLFKTATGKDFHKNMFPNSEIFDDYHASKFNQFQYNFPLFLCDSGDDRLELLDAWISNTILE